MSGKRFDPQLANEVCWTTGEHTESCVCSDCIHREECPGKEPRYDYGDEGEAEV